MGTLSAIMCLVVAVTGVNGELNEADKVTTLTTPAGQVQLNETTLPVEPGVRSEVGKSKKAKLERMAREGRVFVSHYVPGTAHPSLEQVDEAFESWSKDSNSHYSEELVVEMLGALLGETLVREFGMKWVLIEDKFGTDFAVTSQSGRTTAFPFSTIEKRIEDGRTEFMIGVYFAVKDVIEREK